MQTYFVVHTSCDSATGQVRTGTSVLARMDSVASMDDVREMEKLLGRDAAFKDMNQILVTGWQRFEDPESFL